MFRPRMHRRNALVGFSLVELIIAIVVLSVGTIAVITLYSNVGRGQAENSDLQTATQLAQECAEHILGIRRRGTLGYVSVDSTSCSGLTSFSGFGAPTVAVTEPYTATSACSSGSTCKLVTISVSKGGTSFPPISLMLVSY